MKQPVHIVWFKRDLRVFDHRPLKRASLRGTVLPLYVAEPDWWAGDDMAARQWAFIAECLQGLTHDLAHLGQPLVIRVGDVCGVFEEIEKTFNIAGIWSHEETGNRWTYERDLRVGAWCKAKGIEWHEEPQHGVVRRIETRNGWAKHWDHFMGEPITEVPDALEPLNIPTGAIPSAADLGLSDDPCPARQLGGRPAGLSSLDSFLHERGEPYRVAMSSPAAGAEHCSRVSPHLAWGTLSMREVAQTTWQRQRELKEQPRGSTGSWRPSMTSFTGRLHWHCHFMQKLEDEPRLEFRNLHRAYDGMRPREPDAVRLHAWSQGETGLPFVDATMRALNQTGWMNFRMRAMLMAVASYHLWLDWRKTGEHLARKFTDYEPGIHWPQTQMQSGTTGINTVRIYNPVKQGHDQDPGGTFIRRYLPELADVPDEHLHEPWKWDGADAVLGKTYPFPIIDHLEAAKEARAKIWAVRKGRDYRDKASHIQEKHGSRKSGIKNRGERAPKKAKKAKDQLSFDLGEPS